MLTSDLYAKHMLPAKPEGECSDLDSIQGGMPRCICHCTVMHMSRRIDCNLPQTHCRQHAGMSS